MPEDQQYSVTWQIDVDGATPEDAAMQAWEAQTREGTTATVFDVTDEAGRTVRIDFGRKSEATAKPIYLDQGWWHPSVKAGQVHLHPAEGQHARGWSATMHRQCVPVYTRREAR